MGRKLLLLVVALAAAVAVPRAVAANGTQACSRCITYPDGSQCCVSCICDASGRVIGCTNHACPPPP